MTRTRTRVLKDYYISLKDYNLSLSGPFRLCRKVLKLAPPVRVGSWEKGARRGRVFSLKSTKVVQNNLGKGPQGRVFAYGAPNAFHWLKFSSVGPEKCLHVHVHVHVVRKYFRTFVRRYFRKYENISVQRSPTVQYCT